jgi:tetratricopeptide (TPR) repeat protein
MVEGKEHDAPAGTLVHCPPGTLRGAFAGEPGTTGVGIGAKPGEVFQPSGWEWTFAAISHLDQGDPERAREVMADGISRYPEAWQGYYNLACIEARAGDKEAALRNLARAAELEPERVPQFAADDSDFDSVRDDDRFLAVTGQAHAGSPSS